MFQPQASALPGQLCLTTSNSVLHYHCLLLAVAEVFTPDLLAAVMFSGCHHLSLCASGVAIFLRQLAPTLITETKVYFCCSSENLWFCSLSVVL